VRAPLARRRFFRDALAMNGKTTAHSLAVFFCSCFLSAAALAELERREADAKSSAAASAASFRAACAEWGVPGVNLRVELADVARRELPALWARLHAALQAPPLGEGAALYDAFTAYAHGAGADSADAITDASGADASGAAPRVLLPLLVALRQPEGAAVDWEALGYPPEAAEAAAATTADAAADATAGFDLAAALAGDASGDASGAGADADTPTEINWDFDAAAAAADAAAADATSGGDPSAPVEISWDIDMAAAADTGDGGASDDAGGGISWDIGVAAAGDGSGDGDAAPVEISWDVDASELAAEADAQAAALAADSAPIEARSMHPGCAHALRCERVGATSYPHTI
jgi:hypothetical protein